MKSGCKVSCNSGGSHPEHCAQPSASRGAYLRGGMVRLPRSLIGVPRCTATPEITANRPPWHRRTEAAQSVGGF